MNKIFLFLKAAYEEEEGIFDTIIVFLILVLSVGFILSTIWAVITFEIARVIAISIAILFVFSFFVWNFINYIKRVIIRYKKEIKSRESIYYETTDELLLKCNKTSINNQQCIMACGHLGPHYTKNGDKFITRCVRDCKFSPNSSNMGKVTWEECIYCGTTKNIKENKND
ncbi:MAG: hypothetical protein M0P71_00950 [Melioribacteraceae bacterium]|nr:hypothetical protein [Melioribacteraceae bacterium]